MGLSKDGLEGCQLKRRTLRADPDTGDLYWEEYWRHPQAGIILKVTRPVGVDTLPGTVHVGTTGSDGSP